MPGEKPAAVPAEAQEGTASSPGEEKQPEDLEVSAEGVESTKPADYSHREPLKQNLDAPVQGAEGAATDLEGKGIPDSEASRIEMEKPKKLYQ